MPKTHPEGSKTSFHQTCMNGENSIEKHKSISSTLISSMMMNKSSEDQWDTDPVTILRDQHKSHFGNDSRWLVSSVRTNTMIVLLMSQVDSRH